MNNQHLSRVEFANTLRGFAALSVLISHYFGVFWVDRVAVSALTNAPVLPLDTLTPAYIAYLHPTSLFEWGPFGVALFFLISGFVIPFSLMKLDWKAFVINRFFRIVPTYMVGFSITLLAILLSSKYFAQSFPYHTKEILIHYVPGIRDLLHSKRIDGIVWTLETEIKFYAICAIASQLFHKESRKVFFIPVFLGLSSLTLAFGWGKLTTQAGLIYHLCYGYLFASQFIVFMFIGVVFHYLFRKIISATVTCILILFFFALFAFLAQSGIVKDAPYIIGSYFLALLVFTFGFMNQSLFVKHRLFRFLADISYPLYVIHAVTGYVLLRILLDAGFKSGTSLSLATVTVISLAVLLHKYIEVPSQRFGKRFLSVIKDSLLIKTTDNKAPEQI